MGEVSCAAQSLYAEDKLQDPAFINYQLQCLLDRGECDDIGNLVKSKCIQLCKNQEYLKAAPFP